MDFKESLTLGGASYTNWNPVQDLRIDSTFYCDSPVMLPDDCGQSLTIRNRTVTIKRWITPEVLNEFQLLKIYIHSHRGLNWHIAKEIFFLLSTREFETEKACIVVLSPLIVFTLDLTAIFCVSVILFIQTRLSEILNWGLAKTGLREIKRHTPVVFPILLWPEDN